jgi:alkanesulfonate monooxygenase SsuD/methylene tetrahydromethanopterin reductase-like flavin-dependent oxidoreductase (luciferase family)
MEFAIAIPQSYADGSFDPDAFRSYFARAEALGFDSAWAMDLVLGQGPAPHLGPLEAMTYAAACTSRLRLGCAIFVSTLYSPVHLAKSLSSLDQLSRGRLEIGLASGGSRRPFAAFGMSHDRYIARFNEGIDLMKELWTSPRVSFDGSFWALSDAVMEPKPFQKPHPPLWFGGAATGALRRAVRLGSGFFGAGSTATADFRIAKRVYIAIDPDADRARQQVDASLEGIYGRRVPPIEAAAIAGTVEDCLRAVRAVADAGAELICFTPLSDLPGHMELIASEIIPKVAS